jgi:hypothetical protein
MLDEKRLQKIKDDLQQKKGKKALLEQNLQKADFQLTTLKTRLEYAYKVRTLIQEVAKETQKNLEYHISNLVTTAVASVFPNPPEFVTEFVVRRNKTECDLFFKEFGALENPVDASGGGPIDIASNALRYAYWSLKRNRPTFVLDEPFKFVSPDLHHKVSDMLKMLSEKLGIQLIVVSHSEEVNISADKTFLVTKEGEFSKVKVI